MALQKKFSTVSARSSGITSYRPLEIATRAQRLAMGMSAALANIGSGFELSSSAATRGASDYQDLSFSLSGNGRTERLVTIAMNKSDVTVTDEKARKTAPAREHDRHRYIFTQGGIENAGPYALKLIADHILNRLQEQDPALAQAMAERLKNFSDRHVQRAAQEFSPHV